MGFLRSLRRRKNLYHAVPEEEQISRYIYLLNTLPPSVIESAHATAFKDLPRERRREMFAQLRPFMSDAERTASREDPGLLAKLVRRAEERRTTATADPTYVDPRTVMMQNGVMTLVAYQFLLTSSVSAYFTVGAGSLAIDGEPGWVSDAFDPGASGIDAAGFGGYDGGGYGGGFDAGGFGGGFGGGFDGGGFG